MKRIIATTDFSAISLNAINYAADLAVVMHAKLTLMHVCLIPFAAGEVPVSAYDLDRIEDDAKRELENIKEKLLNRTNARIIVGIEVRRGEVLTEIRDYCSMVKPYAVVMGTEGISAIERGIFGGKTLEGIKELRWPLIIVPPNAIFKKINKIGLACDYKEVLESVRVDIIQDIVDEFEAELHVLHVTDKSGNQYTNEMVEESGTLHQMLGELHPKYHFIKETDTEKGLSDFSEQNNLDLLIVVPKKHNLFETVFHHRHTKRLVLGTHIPLMSLHE